MEFNTFLLNNKEKYQGINKDTFVEFYTQAKVHARKIAEAIGLDVSSIETDTPDIRLEQMIKDGDVELIGGLYWQRDALNDARLEYDGIDSDSEQKDEDEDNEF